MKKILVAIIIIFIFQSCGNRCFWKETPLGYDANIVLIEADVEDVFIIYLDSKDRCSGIMLVPPKVTDYNYNNEWIIAKSQKKDTTSYWIIEKKLKDNVSDSISTIISTSVIGPMDSCEYNTVLKHKNIDLRLKKYGVE